MRREMKKVLPYSRDTVSQNQTAIRDVLMDLFLRESAPIKSSETFPQECLRASLCRTAAFIRLACVLLCAEAQSRRYTAMPAFDNSRRSRLIPQCA
jgi:hypothetical protein